MFESTGFLEQIAALGIIVFILWAIFDVALKVSQNLNINKAQKAIYDTVNHKKEIQIVKEQPIDTGEEMISQFVKPTRHEYIGKPRKQELERPKRRSIWQQLKDLKTTKPVKVQPGSKEDGNSLKAF
jgi:hypothetical protein